jgi:phytoene desaturase
VRRGRRRYMTTTVPVRGRRRRRRRRRRRWCALGRSVALFCAVLEGGYALEFCVVGAGIGGLSAASRLAHAGHRVTVIEKNSRCMAGGRIGSLFLGGEGYRFDVGPSLLLLPRIYYEAFSDVGLDLNSIARLKRVDPAYRVFFSDGTTALLSADRQKLAAEVERIAPGSSSAFDDYMSYAQVMLDAGLPNFIEEKLETANLPRFCLEAVRSSPLESHAKQLERRFSGYPKLQAMLSFQDLYVGLSPFQAPAVFSLLQAIELSDSEGVFYPLGGFHSIAQALVTACTELGVDFLWDSPVKEVLVEGGRARGVKVEGGRTIKADVTVLNADLPYSEKNLVPRPFRQRRVDPSEVDFSSSVVAFYFATNKRWSQLEHHSIFLCEENWAQSWDSIFGKDRGYLFDPADVGAVNFYVASHSRTDPGACSEDSDAIMVLVPTPPLGEGESSAEERIRVDEWVQAARATVLQRFRMAGMESFEESIVDEAVHSPLFWRDTFNLRCGSVFGLSHGLSQLSVLRPSSCHPKIKNLHYVGASTRPGNGVPLVLTGASLVVRDILRRYNTLDL